MKKRFIILSIIAACVHLVLAFGSLMIAFQTSMAGFDDPIGHDSFLVVVSGWIAAILNWPGTSIWTPWMSRNLPDFLEWGVFIGNSLLWGFAFALFIRALGSISGRSDKSNQLSK